MNINDEFVNNLCVDEQEIVSFISSALNIPAAKVDSTVRLLKEDNSVPFISRYRKEVTGGLDEVAVRDIFHKYESTMSFFTRRVEIIRNIYEKGKLTSEFYQDLMNATALKELESLYAPYKTRKKTRAMMAEEKGLKKLSVLILTGSEEQVRAAAVDFVRNGVETVQEAIEGAQDIIAEEIAHNIYLRKEIKRQVLNDACLVAAGKGDESKSVYRIYYNFSQKIKSLRPHQVLALVRGENEKELTVKLDLDTERYSGIATGRFKCRNPFFKAAVEDGVKRLLLPSVTREIRSTLHEEAQEHGIKVFAENLKNLLLQPPIRKSRVIGIDPGLRTGCKAAVLDENGKYLGSFLFFPEKQAESQKILRDMIKTHQISLIAIGNGTGSTEVQKVVASVIQGFDQKVHFTVVSEDGASVYSASEIAREEFPDLDLTIRGAVSIGRRIQDPLSELVKIDPEAIGVGLYQHDLNQKELSSSLNEVVESVVNNVGVNLNNASVSILKHVSGISPSQAKKIIQYREKSGLIKSRKEIGKIPGIGPKTLEQATGFLKIPESENPLDNTWVHPENYALAEILYQYVKEGKGIPEGQIREISENHGYSSVKISEIIEELRKPNRDPREDFPMPILQKGVLVFDDLKVGMAVRGRVKNVVDFGAFVDLGIKETGLVHISELSDTYVKNPHDHIKVGDVKDFRIIDIDLDRKRISLSLKGRDK